MPTSFPAVKGVPQTVQLKPIVAATQQPGAIQSSPIPSWDGFNPADATVVPAADGLTAVVTILKAGTTVNIHNSLQNSLNVNVQKTVSLTTPLDPADDIDYAII